MNSRQVLFGILFVLILAIGYGVMRFNATSPTSAVGSTEGAPLETAQTTTTTEGAATSTMGTSTKSIILKPSSLTIEQKKMLSVMGIDPNTIVLTPAMIACGNAGLGSARIKELEGGAAPTFTEGIKLAACYK